MRVVIDMEGVQAEYHCRGITCSAIEFVKSVVRNRGEHEIILVLSGLFQETIEPIRAEFDRLLSQENIRVWCTPNLEKGQDAENKMHRKVAELIRKAFILSLQPDVIHLTGIIYSHVDVFANVDHIGKKTPVTLFCVESFDDPECECRKAHWALQKQFLDGVDAVFILDEQSKKLLSEYPTHKLHFIDKKCLSGSYNLASDFFGICTGLVKVLCSESLQPRSKKPRLAFVSPLPPERTGIADYSAELLPALSAYYEIELITDQAHVDESLISRIGKKRSIEWLRTNITKIDRVIYHFGNSPFHAHMFELLKELPGTVVLHDFFLGHIQSWVEEYLQPNAWRDSIYESHGYAALKESYEDPEGTKFNYPSSANIFQHAEGVIVHSEYSVKLAKHWYGEEVAAKCKIVPLLRFPAQQPVKKISRERLGISEHDFVICTFGHLGETKQNHRLLQAWLSSTLASDNRCILLFVGQNDDGHYGLSLSSAIRDSGLSNRIRITGFVEVDDYKDYLAAADLAVQLRCLSRGETSAAALDCMNYALPLIINANGSMAEINSDSAWVLPDDFDDIELIKALEEMWRDKELRYNLGTLAQEDIQAHHSPERCAKLYADAIEYFNDCANAPLAELFDEMVKNSEFYLDDEQLKNLSSDLALDFPHLRFGKRIYIDVSIISRNDIKTGIQRVTRELCSALIRKPPIGYRVEPVFLSDLGGKWHYRHASSYTMELIDCPKGQLEDEPIDAQAGDFLLLLDLAGGMLSEAANSGLMDKYRSRGVSCVAVVYDLLPVLLPHVFPPGSNEHHAKWLENISELDGAICISRSVAKELHDWRKVSVPELEGRRQFSIDWFHLGANIIDANSLRQVTSKEKFLLDSFKKRPSFLMVGTIEPRKAYLQVIKAFSILWDLGLEVNLIIVGNEGWKNWVSSELRRDIPKTIEILRNHPQLNNRLFWLEGIDDAFLEQVYSVSTCLIAASYGEGFGLPLIEAAHHKLPIIARDIPVFREVAGDHAFYFDVKEPDELAKSIKSWLSLYEINRHPMSVNMSWLTWEQSAQQLILAMKLEKPEFKLASN